MNYIDAVFNMGLVVLLFYVLVQIWKAVGKCVLIFLAVVVILAMATVTYVFQGENIFAVFEWIDADVFNGTLSTEVARSVHLKRFAPLWSHVLNQTREHINA